MGTIAADTAPETKRATDRPQRSLTMAAGRRSRAPPAGRSRPRSGTAVAVADRAVDDLEAAIAQAERRSPSSPPRPAATAKFLRDLRQQRIAMRIEAELAKPASASTASARTGGGLIR